MPKHLWVEMRVMPVELEINPQDPTKIDVFVTENHELFANEDSQIGCWVCGSAIPTVYNLEEECPGPQPTTPKG